MPPLRDLVTRFSFETDQTGVQRFNRTLGGMKNQLSQLAGLVGVAFGTKAIFDSGTALNRANVQLRAAVQNAQDAPAAFELINDSINNLTVSIGGAQRRISDFATEAELTGAAADFFGAEGIEASVENVERFTTILRAAAALAIQENQDVRTSFQNILSGVTGGDVSTLLPLGILDRAGAAFEQFRAQLAASADLLEPQTFERNIDALVNLLQDARPEIEATFEIAEEQGLLDLLEAQRDVQSGFERLGSEAVKALAPLFSTVTELAARLAEAATNADQLADNLRDALPRRAAEFLGFEFDDDEATAQAGRQAVERVRNLDEVRPDVSLQAQRQSAEFQARLKQQIEAANPEIRVIIETNENMDSVMRIVDARVEQNEKIQNAEIKRQQRPRETVGN